MKVQAYVFVDTEKPGPKRIVTEIRKIAGVVMADALFGTPDVIVLVEGDDIATMDAWIVGMSRNDSAFWRRAPEGTVGRFTSR